MSSALPSSITANCQTRICLGVQNGEDAYALSRMLAAVSTEGIGCPSRKRFTKLAWPPVTSKTRT